MDSLTFTEVGRGINFIILFVAWCILVYKGVLWMVVARKSFDWDRFMNFLWTSFALYAIVEVLLMRTEGGFQIILLLVVAGLQLWVAIYRYHPKSQLISRLDVKDD